MFAWLSCKIKVKNTQATEGQHNKICLRQRLLRAANPIKNFFATKTFSTSCSIGYIWSRKRQSCSIWQISLSISPCNLLLTNHSKMPAKYVRTNIDRHLSLQHIHLWDTLKNVTFLTWWAGFNCLSNLNYSLLPLVRLREHAF